MCFWRTIKDRNIWQKGMWPALFGGMCPCFKSAIVRWGRFAGCIDHFTETEWHQPWDAMRLLSSCDWWVAKAISGQHRNGYFAIPSLRRPISRKTQKHHLLGCKIWLLGGFKHFLLFIIYGMSSFPLTNSYFSRWLLHHQPDFYNDMNDCHITSQSECAKQSVHCGAGGRNGLGIGLSLG